MFAQSRRHNGRLSMTLCSAEDGGIVMQLVTVGALASVLALAAPGIAEAAELQEAQAIVSFAGIDTSSEVGADQALHRIRAAAREACGADFGRQTSARRNLTAACVDDAMARAVGDLGAPAVAARFYGDRIYAERGARS
jgi:UrcA family protein